MTVPKDVDSYIANSSKEARPILEEIRKIIKSTVPKVEEGISYGFPFYKYHGTLAHFAEYKNHVAIGFGLDLQNKDKEMLEKNGIKAIQFEFGGTNIDSRTYFQDFYYLLKEKYNIYRILQDGLYEIKQYSELQEIFTTINYFAKLK